MVEMEQQTFPAIKKTQTKEIVIDEREPRSDRDVDQAEPGVPVGSNHLRAQRRVAVHVVDVIGERGIGVMQDCATFQSGGWPGDRYCLVYGSLFNPVRDHDGIVAALGSGQNPPCIIHRPRN